MSEVKAGDGGVLVSLEFTRFELSIPRYNTAGVQVGMDTTGYDRLTLAPATVADLPALNVAAPDVTPNRFFMLIDGVHGGTHSDVRGGWFSAIGFQPLDLTTTLTPTQLTGEVRSAPITIAVENDMALTELLARQQARGLGNVLIEGTFGDRVNAALVSRISLGNALITEIKPGMDGTFLVTLTFQQVKVETWSNLPGGAPKVWGWDFVRGLNFTGPILAAPDGTSGADVLAGTTMADRIDGRLGHDRLLGGGGFDTLIGGEGNDTLLGGAGGDSLDGGLGLDFASYDTARVGVTASLDGTLVAAGDAQGDRYTAIEGLIGSGFDDRLSGGTGNDILYGLAGNDMLYGRNGADSLHGGAGANGLYGEEGNDRLYSTGTGNDTVDGGGGDDYLDLNARTSLIGLTIIGGSGIDIADLAETTVRLDTVDRFAGVERLDTLGTTILGTTGDDKLDFGAFATMAFGGAWSIVINGGAGNDVISGGGQLAADDVLIGGTGDDRLIGRGGADNLQGGIGSDLASYAGSAAGVSVSLITGLGTGGDAQGDILSGIEGLAGSGLNDVLTGNAQDNLLRGELGDDVLNGGNGRDTLVGGGGVDVMTGGADADVFVFDTAPVAGVIDRLVQYVAAEDVILLSRAVFAGLAPGVQLGSFAFNLTGQAVLSTDRIILKTDTGVLFYDADGVNGVAGVAFARITPGLAGFDGGEFLVI